VLALAERHGARMVDLKFTDLPGTWQAVAGEDLIGNLDGSAVDGVGRARDSQDRYAFAQSSAGASCGVPVYGSGPTRAIGLDAEPYQVRAWSGITGGGSSPLRRIAKALQRQGFRRCGLRWGTFRGNRFGNIAPIGEEPGAGAIQRRADSLRLDGPGAKPDQVDNLGRAPM
jgi:hypothetical protein